MFEHYEELKRMIDAAIDALDVCAEAADSIEREADALGYGRRVWIANSLFTAKLMVEEAREAAERAAEEA